MQIHILYKLLIQKKCNLILNLEIVFFHLNLYYFISKKKSLYLEYVNKSRFFYVSNILKKVCERDMFTIVIRHLFFELHFFFQEESESMLGQNFPTLLETGFVR